MAKEKNGLTSLMCAVATNRKQFFDLAQSIERQASCHIDELALQREIDEHYPNRLTLAPHEAHALLMACVIPGKRKSRC